MQAEASRPAQAIRRPLDLRITENLEAIAISIAMALVLKFFVVEAYQIPTGSMQPTILGDEQTGIKDRILADKLVTMLRPPRRWEVMIFRFPLDERRLYVKRIVGLPGETLEIRGGDLWIDGRIARKPDHVNESVLKEVYRPTDEGLDIGRWFRPRGDGLDVRGPRAVFPAAGAAELVLAEDVRDEYLHGYDPDWGLAAGEGGRYAVADLDLVLTVESGPGTKELRLTFEADDGRALFVLPRDGPARVELPAPAAGGALRIASATSGRRLPDGAVHVTARYVDRQALLIVDDEEWLRVDDERGPRAEHPERARLRIALEGGGQVSDVRIRRDIHYTRGSYAQVDPLPEGRWEVPADSYFGLGDNTQASHDGRTWQTVTYELEGGRTTTGFWFPTPRFGRVKSDHNPLILEGRYAFADVHGDTLVFGQEEVESQALLPAPFIHERYLLGKAVIVFWPVFDPFRWKLIR